MRYKRCFCFKLLKTFRVCDSFAETLGFLTKDSLLFIKKSLKLVTYFCNASQTLEMLNNSQTVQNITVFGKKMGFNGDVLEIFKTLNVADLIYKASQNRLLLKNSQNLQNLGFLWKKKWFLRCKNATFLQRPYAWAIFSRKRVKWCVWLIFLKTFEFRDNLEG